MADFLALPQAWLSLSSEESDSHDDTEEFKGVIGEYVDMLDSSERAPSETWLGPLTSTEAEAASSKGGHFKPVTESALGNRPPATTQVWPRGHTGRAIPNGQPSCHHGQVGMDHGALHHPPGTTEGGDPGDEWQDSNETFPFLDCDADPTATPCNVSDQSWSPIYPDDTTSNQSMRPSIAITPPLFVPLYSDWNSALATWGLAWEAHIYGLGSVFTVFGLISTICLLGLPLRCPPGILYFTLLHLFLLAVGGMRAFSLLYDAYSHQERLPPLGSFLLSELPFPCLTSAFALAFLLLSLRSRVRLSLPRSLANPLAALPRPCLLLGLSLLHFAACLGSVGLLQLLPGLPALLLLPQGLFVGLSILLSGSYLVFYCVARADTSHTYRLRDSGEGEGSPEGAGGPARCPFAEADDWARAAGAGLGAALCLLGCGGLQLYGILHALGLGGGRGLGFQPWPWWGYQLGCRLCELGVCLALSLIGTQPLLCHCRSSPRTKSRPRPGSWSRLPCGSPTGGPSLPPQGAGKSPVLPPHYPWSLAQQEKLVVCEVITKGQSEALPLYTLVDPLRNGLQSNPCPSSRPPLPSNPLSPLGRPKAGLESQLSSLDSLGLDTDSTVDLRPPSPIDLSRSIDQALFSETLFPYGLFSAPRLLQASSSLSLNSPSHAPSVADTALYRTSSCGDVDQEDPLSQSRPPPLERSRPPSSPEPWGWKGSTSSTLDPASLSSSSQGLCSSPREKGKTRPVPRVSRGHNPPTQSSLPRAIPQRPHHRHYRTLSSASQDSQLGGRLAGTEELSDSRQLERDLAVQAEFINVCRQIDALSVCSDTIDL
ncbi:proline-rich transmembrane protein 4 [Aplochiton taeniatus]